MTFNYKSYFDDITPKTKLEIYNRFLFAFASVHTSWKSNIKGYELLRDRYWPTEHTLRSLITKSGLGLINTRTKGIHSFTLDYIKNWKQFKKKDNETWVAYADRLEKRIYGLGFAKTRFAIELIYPNEAELVCTDTHIIQWANQSPKKVNRGLLKKIENGFLNHSRQKQMHPIASRWHFWDKKQGYNDPRYWSHVLEKPEVCHKWNQKAHQGAIYRPISPKNVFQMSQVPSERKWPRRVNLELSEHMV